MSTLEIFCKEDPCVCNKCMTYDLEEYYKEITLETDRIEAHRVALKETFYPKLIELGFDENDLYVDSAQAQFAMEWDMQTNGAKLLDIFEHEDYCSYTLQSSDGKETTYVVINEHAI